MISADGPWQPSSSPASLLAAGAKTYQERNVMYGDNFKTFGKVMIALFPEGLPKLDEEGFNRLGVFVQCVSKITRYSANLASGGHQDSAHDLMVYSAMLEYLTDVAR